MRAVLTLTLLLFAVPALAGPQGEGADKVASPYFFVEGTNPGTESFPLKSTQVTANISGVIADVTVTQVYENHGDVPIHAKYGQAYVERYVEALTHEIKSPISAIRGAAEILESPSISSEQRARFLSNIQSETRRIQELVDRMLSLTELEARPALASRTPVALGPVARTIAEQLEPALMKRRLVVDVKIPEDITVPGDPLLIHLAVSNLVQNAVDFSPAGGRISATCTRLGNNVELHINDEGPGIPEFAHLRVFEKFFSLERPDTGRKSTGLGLNFVSEVASLHGGSVDVGNLPEGGLRARLTLPAA